MKKVFVILGVLAMMSIASFAQESKVEVFGGYSLFRADTGNSTHVNLNGWNADLTGYFSKYIGVTADVAGYYRTDSLVSLFGNGIGSASAREYTFMAGPRVRLSTSRVQPFGEALFGLAHSSGDVDLFGFGGGASSNGFAMALGGGLDLGLTKHVAVRPAKLDYLFIKDNNTNFNNLRYSAGVVFKF
jgi:peptidoglycan-associated lipoprotein